MYFLSKSSSVLFDVCFLGQFTKRCYYAVFPDIVDQLNLFIFFIFLNVSNELFCLIALSLYELRRLFACVSLHLMMALMSVLLWLSSNEGFIYVSWTDHQQ